MRVDGQTVAWESDARSSLHCYLHTNTCTHTHQHHHRHHHTHTSIAVSVCLPLVLGVCLRWQRVASHAELLSGPCQQLFVTRQRRECAAYIVAVLAGPFHKRRLMQPPAANAAREITGRPHAPSWVALYCQPTVKLHILPLVQSFQFSSGKGVVRGRRAQQLGYTLRSYWCRVGLPGSK